MWASFNTALSSSFSRDEFVAKLGSDAGDGDWRELRDPATGDSVVHAVVASRRPDLLAWLLTSNHGVNLNALNKQVRPAVAGEPVRLRSWCCTAKTDV